ncbi:hypothetical protein Hanom_Chr16g01461991 [Helianthus anomalus]
MPNEYGAMYPQEGYTAADAPVDMVTLFADFFCNCSLWLSLSAFIADLLEFYRIHISQLSPLGMVRARHFEYCFHSQEIVPTMADFRRFYQMHVQLGFYSFRHREGTPKIMFVPPKVYTAWKTKFFYVKEALETITTPDAGKQDWASTLQADLIIALSNRELQYQRMMLWSKPGVKKKLVVKEKDDNNRFLVRFWRGFANDFEGKIVVKECGEGEEGWYEATIGSFRLPNQAALDAPLLQGKGNVSKL